MTLTAVWNEETFRITFVMGEEKHVVYTAANAIPVAPAPERYNGMYFVTWDTAVAPATTNATYTAIYTDVMSISNMIEMYGYGLSSFAGGKNALYSTTALYMLALQEHTSPMDGPVRERILEHLRRVTSAGHAPDFDLAPTWDYTSLTEKVVLPDSLISIGENAFSGCSGIGNLLDIPKFVTGIENGAFGGCSLLKAVYFHGDAPSEFGKNVFDGCSPELTIFCKEEKAGWTTPAWNGCKSETFDMNSVFESTREDFESAERLYFSGERVSFELEGRAEYYTFDLIDEYAVTLTLSDSRTPVKMEFFDSEYNLIATQNPSEGGADVVLSFDSVSAGTYYLKLSPLKTMFAAGTMSVESAAMKPLLKDEGISSAVPITDNDTPYSFSGLYEYKYFTFDIVRNGTADIVFRNLSEGYLKFEVYQGEKTVVFRHELKAGESFTYSPELQPGRYYIRIYTPWNHGYSGNVKIISDVLWDGTELEGIPGDINGDRAADNADLALLWQYFAGWNPDIDIYIGTCDLDGDRFVTRRDAMILARNLAEWEGYAVSGH